MMELQQTQILCGLKLAHHSKGETPVSAGEGKCQIYFQNDNLSFFYPYYASLLRMYVMD